MRLSQLEGQFIRANFVDGKYYGYQHVDTIGEAQGLMFVCPGCLQKNGGKREGVHSIVIWSRSRGIPDDISPGPGRWTLHGTNLEDLTVQGDPVGTARSIQLSCWHGFIDKGDAHT